MSNAIDRYTAQDRKNKEYAEYLVEQEPTEPRGCLEEIHIDDWPELWKRVRG